MRTKRNPRVQRPGGSEISSGGDLLSHTDDRAVPSALEGLTSEFGMGSGVAPPATPPEKLKTRFEPSTLSSRLCDLRSAGRALAPNPGLHPASNKRQQEKKVIKPHGRLVPVSSTCCHASTPGLLPRGLRGALRSRSSGRHNLEEGFPLRCFQRLSLPDIATRRCHWRDNRNTSGRSIPVLSY